MPIVSVLLAGRRATSDGMTLSVQDGNTPKHLHNNANEMQYILEGTGTIWLGDKEVQISSRPCG